MDPLTGSLKDVDIYFIGMMSITVVCLSRPSSLLALDQSCTQEQLNANFRNGHWIDLGDVQLAFDKEVFWNLDAISSESERWITQQGCVPATTSRVGIVSTRNLEHLLGDLAHKDLRRAFKLLTKSSSVDQQNVSWKGYCATDLGNIQSYAGTLVLQYLDKVLGKVALARASLRELKALFLIILGTITAVSYSKPCAQTHTVSETPTFLIAILNSPLDNRTDIFLQRIL